MTMRVRNMGLDPEEPEYAMPSGGLQILTDGGKTLFYVVLNDDGSIDVSSGSVCSHGGVVLATAITLRPKASNVVTIRRDDYVGRLEVEE